MGSGACTTVICIGIGWLETDIDIPIGMPPDCMAIGMPPDCIDIYMPNGMLSVVLTEPILTIPTDGIPGVGGPS